jgi:SOS-response transcriptional repressor LexA
VTPVQLKCLTYLADYIGARGYSPSFSEIADHMGLASKSGVVRLLNALEDLGKVRRLHQRARSVEVVPGALPSASPGDLAERVVAALLAEFATGDPRCPAIQCRPERALPIIRAALA